MEKLKMHSPNFAEENIERLAELFPGCVTESTDEDGNLKKSIDWDLLKQELSTHIVEGPQERYRLDWPGKREALLTANAPIAKTLRPRREESVDFDTTENLFIEGDNLDALKLLQETYLGKVKMIYIDPPYNTGKDFVYRDNFAESTEEYLLDSGQKDEEGNRLVANTDSNGRFHSDWLSMMYPRLKLARNLLKDDGGIFISIDDNEVHNLRKICDDVFGAENFVNLIVVKMSEMKGAKLSHVDRKFPKIKEYLLIYAKNKDSFRFNPIKKLKPEEELKKYSGYYSKKIVNFEEDVDKWRFETVSYNYEEKIENAEQLIYLVAPDKEKDFDIPLNKFAPITNTNGKIDYFYNQNGDIKKVLFLKENMTTYLGDLWLDISTININKENYSIPTYSNGQKPIDLIKTIFDSFLDSKDIVLDFFAGSGTTGDVVYRTNNEGKSNKFILVQIPEKIEILPGMNPDTKKSIKKMIEFLNSLNKPLYLTEIGKERIRRAGSKILEELTTKDTKNTNENEHVSSVEPEQEKFGDVRASKKLDIGFRVLKVDSSNMADVYYTPDSVKQDQIKIFTDNIKPDRTDEDLLFQVLLDWGVDLTLPITKETIENHEVFFVDGNALVACFVKNGEITEDFCKALAERQPLRVVFRDAGFKDDSVKINVEQIFKLMSPHTDVKTI